MDEVLSEFIAETNEQIEAAASQLVAFEREPSNFESIASIYRLIHTIKGTCGFLDLTRLAYLTHAAETLISRIRDEGVAAPEAVSLILSTVDRVQTILNGLEKTGAEPEGDDTALIEALEGQAISAGEAVPEAVLAPMPEMAEAAIDPMPLPPATPRPAAKEQTTKQVHTREAATIRVAVNTIERIMRLVSELVLTRNQLIEIARSNENESFAIPLQRLSAVTTDLQDGVMQVRMQPIEKLFTSLPRLVRDLSVELDKQIELIVEGSDTEFDRQLVEVLRTPLVHIVRNCADHGIENARDRQAAGKSASGRIRVSATHEASHITIEIADDGRGLDLERIQRKALTQGLVTPAELAAMPAEEVYRFIFAPGFSTARQVTQVSGRGIGMDIVRQTVESIGGSITIASTPGLGAAFKLKLPLTLAIAPALLVTAAGQRFALPQHTVIEAVTSRSNGVSRLRLAQGAPIIHLRDQVLPIVDLKRHLGLSEEPFALDDDRLVVILRTGAATFGVAVDSVADVQEIVVKPLGASLAKVPGFAGNTILGDGTVVLILDVAGLAASLGLATSSNFRAVAQPDLVELTKEPTRLILFRAGPGVQKALPLSQVSRIENIDTKEIELAGGMRVLNRGGSIMPLASCWDTDYASQPKWPVLIIGVGGEPMGLIVSEIVDIVDERIDIEIAGSNETVIGSMVFNGQVTEIVDLAYYMKQARPDAFERGHARKFNILLVDDKQFFRDLLVPVISAAGYDVTAVESGSEALRLVNLGVEFDAAITDIDMPDMNGYALAGALRGNKRFGARTIIAIDAYAGPAVIAAVRAAGMHDVVGKFDRIQLIAKLRDALEANAFGNSAIERSASVEKAA
ncbi:chemotaxis protein CheW [Roseiarcaceae bacterium H3SJ34-1]|uniref:hybrid sensor histidine kinase/response regulator n=1 Tax=Terripilifer ovatus TaxID=3032367 RepID=UPI003AB95EC8|nr:chemotaxis protein CheW [Roseiarcaceae bacterium H3SJ34-1]